MEKAYRPLREIPLANLVPWEHGQIRYGCPDCGGVGNIVPTVFSGSKAFAYRQGRGLQDMGCTQCSGRGNAPCGSCEAKGKCGACNGTGKNQKGSST